MWERPKKKSTSQNVPNETSKTAPTWIASALSLEDKVHLQWPWAMTQDLPNDIPFLPECPNHTCWDPRSNPVHPMHYTPQREKKKESKIRHTQSLRLLKWKCISIVITQFWQFLANPYFIYGMYNNQVPNTTLGGSSDIFVMVLIVHIYWPN